MSKASVQLNLPASLVKRLENDGEARVQIVDLDDIPLEMAKAQIGRALHKTITRTDAVLKDFGDPSQVKRVCDGDIPAVLARAWQRRSRRQQFLRALAEEEATVTIKTVFEIEEKTA